MYMVFLAAVVICYIPAGFKCLKLNNKMSYHSFAHMCVCICQRMIFGVYMKMYFIKYKS